jgi:signal peptide peptidase SppA
MSDTETQEREDVKYPQIIRTVRERPWAILPSTLAAILDMLAYRVRGEELSEEEIQARIGAGPARRGDYAVGSVAVLPLYGVIVPKATLFSQVSGATSVEGFRQSFRAAMADSDVKSIVLDIDSPGGLTDLLPELAAEMRASRGKKPVTAVANTLAASAAYWIGSQADEFVASPSALVGSIGVFAAHDDLSGAQEKLGIKTTLISAGKYKTEANPFEPLSDEARAHIQEAVDDAYATFTSDVAKGRRVAVGEVREGYGEGRVLPTKAAMRAGMIDRIGTLESVVNGSAGEGSGRTAEANTTSTISLWTPEHEAGPIAPHSTATSDSSWDGPANKARLRNDGNQGYYSSAFAWRDADADANVKASYKFIHHEVAGDGAVGAANVTACTTGIAVLNGGRGGTTIPSADRRGVWNHLARHLRDAGREPPPLKSLAEVEQAAKSGLSFADEADALHDSALLLVDRLDSLAEVERGDLTVAKRKALSACPEALREAAQHIEDVLAQTEKQLPLDEDAELALIDLEARLRH